MKWFAALVLPLALLALAPACEEDEEEAPTAMPSPAATVAATPEPTPTPQATPSPEPTLSPEATPTPTVPATQVEGGPPAVSGEPTITASGLQFIDIKVGSGEQPQAGQTVVVHYTGWLADGTKIGSSLDQAGPLNFVLGESPIMAGWNEGIASMKVGGKRRLIIPPELGHGERGSLLIPPNAQLIFDVELIEIR